MLRVHYQAHDHIAGSIGQAHVQWSSLVTMVVCYAASSLSSTRPHSRIDRTGTCAVEQSSDYGGLLCFEFIIKHRTT